MLDAYSPRAPVGTFEADPREARSGECGAPEAGAGRFLSRGDILARLAIDRTTLWRWICDGTFPPPDRKIGGWAEWSERTWSAWRDGLLFIEDVCARLGIGRRQLEKLVRAARWPAADMAVGRWRAWSRAAFEAGWARRIERGLERFRRRREAAERGLAAMMESARAARAEVEREMRDWRAAMARQAEEAIRRTAERNCWFLEAAKGRARRARPPDRTWWEREEASTEPA